MGDGKFMNKNTYTNAVEVELRQLCSTAAIKKNWQPNQWGKILGKVTYNMQRMHDVRVTRL